MFSGAEPIERSRDDGAERVATRGGASQQIVEPSHGDAEERAVPRERPPDGNSDVPT